MRCRSFVHLFQNTVLALIPFDQLLISTAITSLRRIQFFRIVHPCSHILTVLYKPSRIPRTGCCKLDPRIQYIYYLRVSSCRTPPYEYFFFVACAQSNTSIRLYHIPKLVDFHPVQKQEYNCCVYRWLRSADSC